MHTASHLIFTQTIQKEETEIRAHFHKVNPEPLSFFIFIEGVGFKNSLNFSLLFFIFGNIIPNMKTQTHQILFAAVLRLLHPLVRILLRNGVPFGTFADLAKRVYVDVANEEFRLAGKKQTDSRISVITGLNRKEVRRVKTLTEPLDESVTKRYHRAARVISGWVRDQQFLDSSGQPADLPLEGEGASFSTLVKTFSGDMPVRAVLDELLRVECIARLENGSIRLLTRAYLPGVEEGEKLGILGTDVRDLIATIDHNLAPQGVRFFQRKVEYNNLPQEFMERLRALSGEQGQYLLEELDRWLAEHDRDSNPAVEGTGRKRAGLGIYYFEEDFDKGEKP